MAMMYSAMFLPTPGSAFASAYHPYSSISPSNPYFSSIFGGDRSTSVYTSLYNTAIPVQYRNSLQLQIQQGKVAELRLELATSGGKKDKTFATKKIALKKIVANMTMSNNDMIALFPDIIGVMGLPSLEIKKM